MIKTEKEKVGLKLDLSDGMVNGKEKVKRKSYNQINPKATDENIYSVGNTISSLQEKNLLKIKKVEETTIYEEE